MRSPCCFTATASDAACWAMACARGACPLSIRCWAARTTTSEPICSCRWQRRMRRKLPRACSWPRCSLRAWPPGIAPTDRHQAGQGCQPGTTPLTPHLNGFSTRRQWLSRWNSTAGAYDGKQVTAGRSWPAGLQGSLRVGRLASRRYKAADTGPGAAAQARERPGLSRQVPAHAKYMRVHANTRKKHDPMREHLNHRWAFAGAGIAILLLATVACTQVGPRVWSQLAGGGGEQALGGAMPVMPAATVVVGAAGTTGATGTAAAGTPTAAATGRAGTGPRNVAVRRGPIAEVLQTNGHVSSAKEIPLAFARAGRVDTVAVQPGQSVQAGDVLVTLEAKDITKDLEAARSHLEVSMIQLQQAQARQRAAEQQAQLDRTRQQDTVAEA